MPWCRSRHGERGSGTVLAVGMVAGMATVLVSALALVAVLVAGQQARTAADLAALAAAGELVGGGGVDACSTAAGVATEHGARLTDCRELSDGPQPWPRISVTVTREVGSTPWTATARAVAGAVVREDPP